MIQRMKRTINNVTLWAIIVAAFVAFVPTAIFMPRQWLFIIMDSVCVAVGAGVAVGYVHEAWLAVRLPRHQMTAAHLIIVGTFIVSLATICVFSGQLLWRINGKPDWIIDSIPVAFSRWMLGTGLILSLLTSYSREGVIVVSAYKKTAVLVTIAVFLAAVLIGIGLG